MKSNIIRFLAPLLVLAITFGFACDDTNDPVSPENQSSAKVRVIHTSYDAPAVDVRVDDEVAFSALTYGMSSGYAELPSGVRNVKVSPAGETSPVVIEADLDLTGDTDYTVYAVDNISSIEPVVSVDDRSSISDMAKIRFLHASPDAPAVDIKLNSGDGPTVFSNNSFKSISAYTAVEAGFYTFVVTPAGSTDEVFTFNPISVADGNILTVVAHGTLDDGDNYPFAVRVFIDNNDGNNYTDLTFADSPMAAVRVIHTSYDAPSVDVWVDGSVAISDLAYGMSSGYAMLNSGTRTVQVTPTGQTAPIVIDADLSLAEDAEYTVFAVDQLAMIMPLVSMDMREPNSGMAKVRFVHASPDAPAVDIKLNGGDGPAVFSDRSFGEITDYAEVNSGDYTFAVTPAGSSTEVVIFNPVNVSDGLVYTVVAHGTLDNADEYPFAVRVFVDNNNGDAYIDLAPATSSVMAVHASPDAPGVDLLVDNLVINNAPLEFPDNTGYLGIASGDRNIKVNVFGTENSVIETDLNLDTGQAYSIFAIDEVSEITALVLVDDLSTPASGMSHVRFIHLSPDAPAVDITLTDGTIVFGNKAFGEYTDFTPLHAGSYDLQVRLQGTDTVVLELPGIELADGYIYTVFARGFAGGQPSLGAEIIVNN